MRGKRARNTEKDKKLAPFDFCIIKRPRPVDFCIIKRPRPDKGRRPYKNLSRRVTAFEYESVLNYAAEKGIKGFSQLRSSADKKYTPDF